MNHLLISTNDESTLLEIWAGQSFYAIEFYPDMVMFAETKPGDETIYLQELELKDLADIFKYINDTRIP